MPLQSPPYAEVDDTTTMRRDCRVTAVRLGLADPRDRAVAPGGTPQPPRRTPLRDQQVPVAAASLAARLGLSPEG